MLGKKLGIDLGSTTLRIASRGEGIVVTEPSLLARQAGHGAAIAFGAAAARLDGRPGVTTVRPIRDGQVADAAAADALLTLAVSRVAGRQRIFKPDIVMVVMSGLPGEQRRGLLDTAGRAGARSAYLLDGPIAAAMGVQLALESSNGHLVIDAGGGRTEVSALAEEGTVAGRCLPGGTGRLGAAMATHLRVAHGIQPSPAGIDEMVGSLAAVGPHALRQRTIGGPGRDVIITSEELGPFADAYAAEVAQALRAVLDEVPAPLVDDIRGEGILLCGGGAAVTGLDRHLAAACGIPVHVPPEPRLCAVRGAGIAAENLDALKRNVMYLR